MLLRLVVAVESNGLADRIFEAAELLEVDIRRVKVRARGNVLERVGALAGDVVIVSRRSLGEVPESTVDLFRGLPERPAVVALVEDDDAEDRARLVAGGCDAVLGLDIEVESLREALRAVVDRRLADAPPPEPESAVGPRLADFATGSDVMASFVDTASRVASSNTSLLVLGETGSGKEHLARAIHAESGRSGGPFVAVNCGAIPESLLESELFGHEQGSFTGATRSRKGWFEQAHTGTLFLDEIGELPQHLQVKLLRVLQFREVRRVGSERDLPVDVRIIAATNRDVESEVKAGRFRADLYYRLGVVTLLIPPLRDRADEVPGLVDRLLVEVATSLGRPGVELSAGALEALCAYSWPGNVRELANVLERAALLCADDVIELADLPTAVTNAAFDELPTLASDAGDESISHALLSLPMAEARERVVERFERAYLSEVLRAANGRVGEAARRAGIDPRSLYNKMRRYRLRKESFRSDR